MALTSRDETDLILPLLRGIDENPAFSTFLGRLKRRLGVNFAALHLRSGEATSARYHTCDAPGDVTPALTRADRASPIAALFERDRPHLEALRPGRVYSLAELVEHDPVARIERRRAMAALGLQDERVVRLALHNRDAGGGHAREASAAWLAIARKTQRCSASEGALLSNLAPYLAEALDLRTELSRERADARIARQALSRSRRGWMMFDREARLVDIDPATAQYWEEHLGARPRLGERLLNLPLATERNLAALAQAMPSDRTQSHALLLSEDPHLEALLVPRGFADDFGEAAEPAQEAAGLAVDETRGALLALLPLPAPPSPQAASRLCEVHGLPLREAQLALALADGASIAQGAQALGLSLETARNYSKRIYARLGVSGQTQLVKRIHEGTAPMR